jgi:hypothetical protein
MKEKTVLQKGFTRTPHLILGTIFILDVGRNRYISIGALGTPNEMVFINQKHPEGDITDMVCLHNFDYDGLLTARKLSTIISVFANSTPPAPRA